MKKLPNVCGRLDILVPHNTLIVLTTASFAVNPVISEVEILQSPKPSGVKIGATHLPSTANRLFALSVTTLSLVSKVCKNHMMIVATNIIVNALCKKSFALSHISCNTLFTDGRR